MALIIDFDSTLIDHESITSLSDEKEKEKIEEITEKGINGMISMIESYKKRLEVINITEEKISGYIKNIDEKLTYKFSETLELFRKQFKDVQIYVVSQGLRKIVEPICMKYYKIEEKYIYAVDFKNIENICEEIKESELLKYGKSHIVKNLNKNKPTVIIGDGYSDASLRKENYVDICIGFGVHRYDPIVESMSDFYIRDPDLLKSLFPILINIFSSNIR